MAIAVETVAAQPVGWRAALLSASPWLYLLLITVAELVTAAVSAQAGQVLHVALLAALMLHAALGPRGPLSRLALALTLAPLIRILSLSLPLRFFPQLAWYPIVAAPLLIAAWMIIRQLGLGRGELGLRRGSLPIQLGLVSMGVLLGAAEYFILAPRPQFSEPSAAAVTLAALNLLVCTGFSEELIFRGVLQSLGARALGRWSLLYVALLFGVLHIGYLSWLDVVFVAGVGLLFAYLVRWTGSILGVTLVHGLTNSMLFLVMPAVSADPRLYDGPWALATVGVATAITLVTLAAIIGPRLFPLIVAERAPQVEPARERAARPQATLRLTGLREARREARLTYAALAQRTGLTMRALAEIEHGMRAPLPDELQQISLALGQSSSST